MNIQSSRQNRRKWRAKSFGEALREGLTEDVMLKDHFNSNLSFSKQEKNLQTEMETMLEELCDREREEQNRREAEAARRAFKRGLELDVKTE